MPPQQDANPQGLDDLASRQGILKARCRPGLTEALAGHRARRRSVIVPVDPTISKWGIGVAVGVNDVDKKWVRGSPLKGALLALLLGIDEPTHGYRLATLLAERLGPSLRFELDGVYKMLKAFEKAGLVASELRESEVGSWRRQSVYGPTDLTEQAVGLWMAEPVSDDAARPELLVKIACSRPCDIPVLLDALNALEMRRMDRLGECERAVVPMSSWSGLATNAACGWTEEHLQADLRWIMSTRDWMRDYADQNDVFRR